MSLESKSSKVTDIFTKDSKTVIHGNTRLSELSLPRDTRWAAEAALTKVFSMPLRPLMEFSVQPGLGLTVDGLISGLLPQISLKCTKSNIEHRPVEIESDEVPNPQISDLESQTCC